MMVVFDAYLVPEGRGSEEDYHGLKVIYTAENEPADIRMGFITNTIKDRQIYLVSSDSLVQQDAFVHGALRISSGEFMSMVDRAEEDMRRILMKQNNDQN
jgi:predicted RNA-binding protein with PIN domain